MSVLTLNVNEVMRTLSAESSSPFVAHDKEVDIVRFAINSGFADIVLDGQVALRVMYQRPRETEVRAQTLTYYDTDGLHNYYDWQLSQSDLEKNGSLMVALCILDISGGEVSEWHTTPCVVRVLSTIHTDDSDEGDDTITPTVKERVAVLESMIQRVASGAPIVVTSTSAMTDTEQIYVLATDGKWYYHNGSAWVAGGEYGAVSTDTTLTQSGIPADAKTVGDEITELKGGLNDKVDNYTNAEFSVSNKRISYGIDSIADGVIVTALGFYITDYFPCAPGTVVTFYGMDFYYRTGYKSFVIAFYDVNMGLVSGITHVTEDTVSSVGVVSATAPADTAYVAFCTNGLNDGYYAHIHDFNTDDIARKTDLKKIDAEIELIKAGKIGITGNDIIQGSYNASGQVVANSKRIRTIGLLEANAGDILHFVPGSNASQMLFGRFNTNKVFIADSTWYTSSANINIPSDGYLVIVFRNTANTDILPTQFDAEVELRKYFADTNANIELDEWRKKTNNARHIPNDSATPLTLLHFSDLHADQTALGRIMNHGKNLVGIDDYICTGDMVGNTATQIESWWPKNVMTCIGNHDAAAYSAEAGYDWTALSIVDRIAYYIAPFESNWNIIRGSGQSYYYKDYVTQKVRLIVLDSQIYKSGGADATAQTQWLTDLLASAITGNYHVLIAIHAPVNNAPVIECGFSRYGRTNMATLNDSYTPQDVVSVVSTAISNGLHFVGYIVGHNHQDYIYMAAEKQLGFCITCANVSSRAQWRTSDQNRDANSDAFNLLTIDTENKLVKVVRAGGADIDDHMRARKAICFNYSNGEIVGEVL